MAYETNRDPFAAVVDALGRGADSFAAVPGRQQERQDKDRARTDALTEQGRSKRFEMLQELYDALASLDPSDPQDQPLIEEAQAAIGVLLEELDLEGEEAVRSLGRGTVTTQRRQSSPAQVQGDRLTVEGSERDITPAARADILREITQPVGQVIASAKAGGARAERRREVEREERQFEHQEFMTRLGFELQGLSREDEQEFQNLMAQAQREHEAGQLSTQLKSSMRELLARLGHDVNENRLNRELQTYLQERQQEHEKKLHEISIDAEANERLYNTLWQQATSLVPVDEDSKGEVKKFQTSLQGHVARGSISESQAVALADQASFATGLKAEELLGRQAARRLTDAQTSLAESQAELTGYQAAAAAANVDLLEYQNKRLKTTDLLGDGEHVTQKAFEAAERGDLGALATYKAIAVGGTEAGYSEGMVAAARSLDFENLENRAREILEDKDEFRRIALDEAKTALDGGTLDHMEARNEFSRSVAATFESAEEAEAYLSSLKPSERAALGLSTAEGRQAFLAQIDYSLKLREQGEWAQQLQGMWTTPVDNDQWESQFIWTAEMSGMDAKVAEQIAQGLRRVANMEDRDLEAKLAKTWAEAELMRAEAGGAGGVAFKEKVTALEGLLGSVRHEMDLACNPDDALGGENARVDQQACDIAKSKLYYWQGVLEDVTRSGGVDFGTQQTPEQVMEELIEEGKTYEDMLASGVFGRYPHLEDKYFPKEAADRRNRLTVEQAPRQGRVTDLGPGLEALDANVIGAFQGFARIFTSSNAPTARERHAWQNYGSKAPLIQNFLQAANGNAEAKRRLEVQLVEAAKDMRVADPAIVEEMLREDVEGTLRQRGSGGGGSGSARQ